MLVGNLHGSRQIAAHEQPRARTSTQIVLSSDLEWRMHPEVDAHERRLARRNELRLVTISKRQLHARG
jgi:hypothetical protein